MASTETSVPFRAGQEGYASFRIPAVVATGTAGTLLAFCEGRVGSRDDFGNIDIVLKRSTDGGLHLGPAPGRRQERRRALREPGPRRPRHRPRPARPRPQRRPRHRGRHPPRQGRAPPTAAASGSSTATTTASPGRPRRRSPRSTKKDTWRWYATTPGHALRLSTGRLVVPANHSLPRRPARTPAPRPSTTAATACSATTAARPGASGTSTTTPTATSTSTRPPQPNSPTAASTSTPATNSTAPGTRADAYSPDGGQTLVKPFRPQAGLTGPVVQGSVLQLRDPDALLYSGPADPAARALMTIRASTRRRRHLAARAHRRRAARRRTPTSSGSTTTPSDSSTRRATSARTRPSPSAGCP